MQFGCWKKSFYGVSMSIDNQELKDYLTGGNVLRFKGMKEGKYQLFVLLLGMTYYLVRVYLGCMTFHVNMRCFKCQKFGHVADAYRGS